MNTSTELQLLDLQHTGCSSLADCLGLLLISLGSLIKAPVMRRAGLDPQCGDLLISVGRRLRKTADLLNRNQE